MCIFFSFCASKLLVTLFRNDLNEAVGGGLEVNYVAWEHDFSIPVGTDILVNATSIGLFPDVDARIALDLSTLAPSTLVADVIPNPPETHLVRGAREKGCRVIDGLGMLVAQGVIGIEYWTGQSPNPAVMRAGLEEVFS